MVALSTIPMVVDIAHYGGDTLRVKVVAAAEITDGMDWAAEVRTTRESDVVDATFTVVPPESSGGPAYLVLPSADVSRLVGTAPIVLKRLPTGFVAEVKRYSGEYDCEVHDPVAPDPVRTLVQGKLTIEIDVTRPT